MNKIEQIKGNEVYKQILIDSFGGIMYNVDNRNKYDTTELLHLWNSATAAEQEVSGGILKGAINFVQGAM
jgi:hypothetical protein